MKTQVFSIAFCFNQSNYFLQTQKIWSLQELLRFFNFHQSLVVIEHNGNILSFQECACLSLKNNDKIEILTIVGGG